MEHMRLVGSCIALGLWLALNLSAQTQQGEWRSYNGDPGSTKYAPLDQINRTNVKNLRIAWRRPAVDPLLKGKDPKLDVPNNFRATPLMVAGVLYSPNGVGLVANIKGERMGRAPLWLSELGELLGGEPPAGDRRQRAEVDREQRAEAERAESGGPRRCHGVRAHVESAPPENLSSGTNTIPK